MWTCGFFSCLGPSDLGNFPFENADNYNEGDVCVNMVNRIVKNPDVQLAEEVLRRYAYDLEGLTEEDCRNLETAVLTEDQIAVLLDTFDRWKGGKITPERRQAHASVGLDSLFTETLADDNDRIGIDGGKAFRLRAQWLSDHFVTKWWRPDFNQRERVMIAQELGAMGMFPQTEFPELLAMRGEDLASVIGWEFALQGIGAAFVVPHLVKGLSSPDRTVRFNCVSALASVFAENITETAPLVSLLKDEDVEIRHLAARALGKRAATLVSGLYELLFLLGNDNQLVRLHVLEALDIFVAFASAENENEKFEPVSSRLNEMISSDPNPECQKAAKSLLVNLQM